VELKNQILKVRFSEGGESFLEREKKKVSNKFDVSRETYSVK